jgi:hypothetical protein
MDSFLFSTPSEPRLDLLDLFYDNLYIPIPTIPKGILMENLSRVPRILLLSYYAYGAIWVQDLPENNSNSPSTHGSMMFSFDPETSSKKAPLHQLGIPYLELARKELSHAIDNPTPLVAHALFVLGLYCVGMIFLGVRMCGLNC